MKDSQGHSKKLEEGNSKNRNINCEQIIQERWTTSQTWPLWKLSKTEKNFNGNDKEKKKFQVIKTVNEKKNVKKKQHIEKIFKWCFEQMCADEYSNLDETR